MASCSQYVMHTYHINFMYQFGGYWRGSEGAGAKKQNISNIFKVISIVIKFEKKRKYVVFFSFKLRANRPCNCETSNHPHGVYDTCMS